MYLLFDDILSVLHKKLNTVGTYKNHFIHVLLMHQSVVTTAPMRPGIAGVIMGLIKYCILTSASNIIPVVEMVGPLTQCRSYSSSKI